MGSIEVSKDSLTFVVVCADSFDDLALDLAQHLMQCLRVLVHGESVGFLVNLFQPLVELFCFSYQLVGVHPEQCPLSLSTHVHEQEEFII